MPNKITGGYKMLKHIKEMIPYPYYYLGAANTIYSIAEDRKLREHVKYNGELDQFEIPISELNKRGKLPSIIRFPQKIEGTSISYYVDRNNNFCFKIE